jgi:hypothetical protein
MLNGEAMSKHYSEFSDEAIHELARAILLSKEDGEIVLGDGQYFYKVKGGESGHLFYRKGNRDWVLIANWCFYGLYIVVRYRKAVWLRPMYRSLFAQMNFISVTFYDHSIELVDTDGKKLRSRRFRLSPPKALEEVMADKFGYSPQKVEDIKAKVGI